MYITVNPLTRYFWKKVMISIGGILARKVTARITLYSVP